MKKTVRFLVIVFLLAFMMAAAFGCVKKGVSGGADNQGAPVSPQKAFIDGVKEIITDDATGFQAGEENGASLLGLSSDFINDLNNSSNKTAIAATLKNLVLNGEASTEQGNIGLDIAHNAESGDSSVDLSIGQGSDTNLACGIYIKDGTALLKPASADKNVLRFTMPESADKTLTGSMSELFSGLITDSGKTDDSDSSSEARRELADKVLDPWMDDTKLGDYTDSNETRNILDKDVGCRVITLSLSGQTAYDFMLKNIKVLDEDAQFDNINGSLGVFTNFMSTEAKDIINNSDELDSTSVSSATKQMLDELEALTDDEIAGAAFKMSVIFYDGKAVGIELVASTSEKEFKLNMLAYEKELEYQMNFYFENLDGSSLKFDMSKIKKEGDTYQVSSTLKALNAEGVQTMTGNYNGTDAATDNSNDITGTFKFSMQMEDADGVPQEIALSGDTDYSMNKTDSGYSGSGEVNLSINAADSQISLTLAFTANMEKSKDIVITAPMFTSGNVSEVTDFKSVCDALGQDYSGVEDQNALVRGIYLFKLLLVS